MRIKKWTKGDWEIIEDYRTMFLVGVKQGKNEVEVCDVASDIDDDGLVQPTEEQIANANLIRAAPKLVDALESISEMQNRNYGYATETHMELQLIVLGQVHEALAQAYRENPE